MADETCDAAGRKKSDRFFCHLVGLPLCTFYMRRQYRVANQVHDILFRIMPIIGKGAYFKCSAETPQFVPQIERAKSRRLADLSHFSLREDAFISELTWHKYSDDQQMNDGSSGVPSWRLFVRAHCQLRRVPVAQLVVFVLALKVWKNIHINPPD